MKRKLTAPVRLGAFAGLAAAIAAMISACGQPASKTQAPAPAAREARNGEGGYLPAPEVLTAVRAPSGAIVLTGHAPPESLLRLASPEGNAFGASAGPDGQWRLELAPVDRARMFAMSADAAGRPVHAQGALVVLPAPSPVALMVRSGYGALPVGRATATPVIVAVDYDPAGVAAVAGLTAPHAPVRLSLDGAMAGQTRADALGRFAVLAPNHPLAPGSHLAAVATPGGDAQLTVQVAPAAPLSSPYRAVREGAAWRIDWALSPPGSGLQTTVIPDPAQGPSA